VDPVLVAPVDWGLVAEAVIAADCDQGEGSAADASVDDAVAMSTG
jgi:hypothetical protein